MQEGWPENNRVGYLHDIWRRKNLLVFHKLSYFNLPEWVKRIKL